MAELNASIIIVNWNTRELLDRNLTSLATHLKDWPHEVIVVDNASSDGSAAMVRAKHPQVRLIETGENAGFARGCNRGVTAAAGSRSILFLNPDAEVHDTSIQQMEQFLQDHPDVGAVTCALQKSTGGFQEAQGHRLPTWRTALNQYLFLNRLSDRFFPGIFWMRPPASACAVEWISGAVFLVRRTAMPKGPFFDESYFMYAEDMEASVALRARGWTLWMLPQARVTHWVKQGTGQSESPVFRMQIENPIRFLKRHLSWPEYAVVRLCMTAGIGLRWLAYGLAERGAKMQQQGRLLNVLLGRDA